MKNIHRILFVCLGNICRSPMAEYIMKELVHRAGRENEFIIASAGTSSEEVGNPVHPCIREKLFREGIPCPSRQAIQLRPQDLNTYDLMLGMDQQNLKDMRRIFGLHEGIPGWEKTCLLLDYSNQPRDIADPWFTRNFDATYHDILEGCQGLLSQLIKK